MKLRLSIASLLASTALAMGAAQPAFSAGLSEPIVVAQAEGDDALRTAVEAAIAADANLGSPITVEAEEGQVTLSGTVANEQQKSAAEAAAAGVEGVAGVTNDLTAVE